jgi:ATP-binding protein involved in chromosome partitioning
VVPSDVVVDAIVDVDRLIVILGVPEPSRELLSRTHEALSAAAAAPNAGWPRDLALIEVRSAGRIHRGGRGFGPGRHVLCVLGGKGGVGKSTVAVNLALTLTAMGVRIGLLDCDINAPDIPHMLGMPDDPSSTRGGRRPRPVDWQIARSGVRPRSQWRRPASRYGVELMSVGFEVPQRFAPRITSRLQVQTLLRDLVFETDWTADVLVLDAPPGTGEEIQAIVRELPLSGALFVTTPQDLAQMDAERTLALLGEHDVPAAGVVKNMASLRCPHCDERIDLFAKSSRLEDAGLTVLGEIPFDARLSESVDAGHPLVLADPRGPVALEFARIAVQVRRWLAASDADGK